MSDELPHPPAAPPQADAAPTLAVLLQRMHGIIAETKRCMDDDRLLRAQDKLNYLAGLVDAITPAVPDGRLRELAVLGALDAHVRAMHNGHALSAIAPDSGHVIDAPAADWGFSTCPHPDCALVRARAPLAGAAPARQQAEWQDIAAVPVPDALEFIIAAWPVDIDAEGEFPYDVGEAWRDSPTLPWFCAVTNAPIKPTHWQMLPYPPNSNVAAAAPARQEE